MATVYIIVRHGYEYNDTWFDLRADDITAVSQLEDGQLAHDECERLNGEFAREEGEITGYGCRVLKPFRVLPLKNSAPASKTAHVIVRQGVEYNDEYYYQPEDEATVETVAYRDKAKAQKIVDELNGKSLRENPDMTTESGEAILPYTLAEIEVV